MSDTRKPDGLPPEPGDEEARRREKLMAYHLGALDDDEAALTRGRIESDPEWRSASDEAQAMIEGLKADGAPADAVPEGLGDRTARRLRDEPDVPGDDGESRPLDRVPFAFTWRVAAAVFVAAALPALWLGGRYVLSRPDRVSLLWRAEGELAAGAPYAPFLVVRHTTTKEPIAGVAVAASLVPDQKGSGPVALGEGTSDATGVVSGDAWRVPDVPPGDYKFIIEAKSGWGTVLDRVVREVKVSKAARLAVAPDRAQARPGETIRVRTLLVTEAGSKPLAERPVVIDLLD
ncbi:MAG: anti-sigma factor family protein, partial [Planctomycetota bacterium]